MYTYAYIYIYIYIYTSIHIHVYTYIHVSTYIYTQSIILPHSSHFPQFLLQIIYIRIRMNIYSSNILYIFPRFPLKLCICVYLQYIYYSTILHISLISPLTWCKCIYQIIYVCTYMFTYSSTVHICADVHLGSTKSVKYELYCHIIFVRSHCFWNTIRSIVNLGLTVFLSIS